MTSASDIPKKERVIVYIDGFNLYFGLLEAGFRSCKWLDLRKLAQNLKQPNQEIIEIKYFTSRISNDPDDKSDKQHILKLLISWH